MAKSIGIIGLGGQALGPQIKTTILDEQISGKIVCFEDLAFLEDIIKAETLGAFGFFCPGINYREFINLKKQGSGFPVVITEGFGFDKFSDKISPVKELEIDGKEGKVTIR